LINTKLDIYHLYSLIILDSPKRHCLRDGENEQQPTGKKWTGTGRITRKHIL